MSSDKRNTEREHSHMYSAQQQSASLPQVIPFRFDEVDIADVLNMVIEMINRLINHNDAIRVTPATLTRFHSRAAPSISINDYLRRIVKYASIEKSTLLVLLIYIDRACEENRSFIISSLTAHRFIITAITAGSKAVSDIYCPNTHFAKVGGISVQELNLLEVEFCMMIKWRLAVNRDILQQYYVDLVRISTGYNLAPPPLQISQSSSFYLLPTPVTLETSPEHSISNPQPHLSNPIPINKKVSSKVHHTSDNNEIETVSGTQQSGQEFRKSNEQVAAITGLIATTSTSNSISSTNTSLKPSLWGRTTIQWGSANEAKV